MRLEEEKNFEETENPEANGADTEQPDEQQTEGADTLSDEEKEQALADNKNPPGRKDPTEGMTDRQAKDYWAKRAQHFEGEYKTERTKRQEYAKQYGGLSKQQDRPPDHGIQSAPRQQTWQPPQNFDLGNVQVPDNVQDLKSYTAYILNEANKAFEHRLSERQLDSRVETTESKAREVHNGEDNLPSYDELVDSYVVPLIQKNPRIFELIRLMPDPAETSYTLGFLLKYPRFDDILKSHTRDELVKNINNTAKWAGTVKGKAAARQPSGRLTKQEIDAMTPEAFEKELERFRNEI